MVGWQEASQFHLDVLLHDGVANHPHEAPPQLRGDFCCSLFDFHVRPVLLPVLLLLLLHHDGGGAGAGAAALGGRDGVGAGAVAAALVAVRRRLFSLDFWLASPPGRGLWMPVDDFCSGRWDQRGVWRLWMPLPGLLHGGVMPRLPHPALIIEMTVAMWCRRTQENETWTRPRRWRRRR